MLSKLIVQIIFALIAQQFFFSFSWLETVTSQWGVQSLILFLKALSVQTEIQMNTKLVFRSAVLIDEVIASQLFFTSD